MLKCDIELDSIGLEKLRDFSNKPFSPLDVCIEFGILNSDCSLITIQPFLFV